MLFFKKKNWELCDSCPRGTGNQSNLLLCGTKWILVGLGFSGATTARSWLHTVGMIRARQHFWNLFGAPGSVFLSKQVLTVLSVRHLAIHTCYSWPGLG